MNKSKLGKINGRERIFLKVGKQPQFTIGDTISIGGDPLLYEVCAITGGYLVALSLTENPKTY